MDNDRQGVKREIHRPRLVWTDFLVRFLRASGITRVVASAADRVIPLLFAVFVAAPIGLVMWLFFIPKFVRNAQRRRKYEVRLVRETVPRIAGVRRG